MQLWTITSADSGTVLAACFPTSSAGSHPKDSGWAWVTGEQKAWRIDAAPDLACERWSGAGWEPDLGALRALRWSEVKTVRDEAEGNGCATPLGRVDTDPASQVRIAGAVQMAMLSQVADEPFSIAWTMQDNTIVEHDAEAMITLGLAVGLHVRACHDAGRVKREQLEIASDPSAIAAVDLSSDWPA